MRRFRKIYHIAVIWALIFVPLLARDQRQYQVEEVEFEGNTAFSDSRLHRLMLTKPSGFLSGTKYYHEVFEDDISNILSFYRQNGFLEVALKDTVIIP